MNTLHRTDLRACYDRLRDGSRTFFAASFLLPRQARDPAAALYAFCRVADDAIDLGSACEQTVAGLRERLVDIYRGQPAPYPEDRAFACVVEHFGIPRTLPEALLEGFEWDVGHRRFETIDDLHGYSARVAGTVGAMMALIMGVRTPTAIARACELGMAMQLTNIARDVGEDARAGRIYLPLEWLREVGIEPQAWLQAPSYSDKLGRVIQRLLDTADELYNRADSGIGCLPATCRMGIRSARLIYAEIGREVERRRLDSVSGRAIVSTAGKLSLLWQAIRSPDASEDAGRYLVPEPARFLVDAVAAAPDLAADGGISLPAAWWELNKRWAWAVELFDQLDQRKQSSPY